MRSLKNIIFGTTIGLIVTLGLLLLTIFPGFLTLFIVFFGSLSLLLSFYSYVKKTREWKESLGGLTVLLLCSQIGLVSIIEHVWVRLFVIFLSGMIFGLLYGAGVVTESGLSSLQKPYRRFVLSAWVMCVFGMCSSIFALQVFLPIPFVFVCLLIVGGSLMGYVASFVWQMYFSKPKKVFLLWMVLVGFVGMQLFWAMHFLPLGYLNLGMFMTWAWYLVVLFARFHFDQEGIDWKQQWRFLLTNAILFVILVMFFVRWT